jgi:hypothetical protein
MLSNLRDRDPHGPRPAINTDYTAWSATIELISMEFSDRELARRLERAEADGGASFVEARRRLFPDCGALWIEVAGAKAMFDGPHSPVTQTFGLGLNVDPTDDDLLRLETFFLERGAPVSHEVSPLAGVQLAHRLCERGYRPIELTSVMYQPLPAENGAAGVSGVRTRLAEASEATLWSKLSVRGWSEHANLEDFLLGMGQVGAVSEGSVALLAEVDGMPVATAMLRCHGGVALFAGASTIPEARRRGAQQALLHARMDLAAREGCDLAMICAEPGSASQRNAERHGFRIAYTRTKWQLPVRAPTV